MSYRRSHRRRQQRIAHRFRRARSRHWFWLLPFVCVASYLAFAEPPERVPGPPVHPRQNAEGVEEYWAIRAERVIAEEPHDFTLTGWATAGGGTTGGEGGETVTVSTAEDLVRYIAHPEPLVIEVKGTIDLGEEFPGYKSNGRYYVGSNKTIVGVGDDAGIRRGEFRLARVSNVIIRNLSFTEAPDTAIAITHGTTHVWIDHNDFSDAGDGLLDITRGADFITVSWNRFWNHDKVSLVGAGDDHKDDRDRLRVTYHHNWFFNTTQRHPRVRFGRVHLFNNYFDVQAYGVGIGVEAEVVSEQNYFESAGEPFRSYDTSERPGFFIDTGSLFPDRARGASSGRRGRSSWSPQEHYEYTVNNALHVPYLVATGAGVGIINREDSGEVESAPPVRVPPSDGRPPPDRGRGANP